MPSLLHLFLFFRSVGKSSLFHVQTGAHIFFPSCSRLRCRRCCRAAAFFVRFKSNDTPSEYDWRRIFLKFIVVSRRISKYDVRKITPAVSKNQLRYSTTTVLPPVYNTANCVIAPSGPSQRCLGSGFVTAV